MHSPIRIRKIAHLRAFKLFNYKKRKKNKFQFKITAHLALHESNEFTYNWQNR